MAALAKKRKAMKVPAVTEADLEIEHDFTNTNGQVVKAQFVEADDKMVSLLMARRSKLLLNWRGLPLLMNRWRNSKHCEGSE